MKLLVCIGFQRPREWWTGYSRTATWRISSQYQPPADPAGRPSASCECRVSPAWPDPDASPPWHKHTHVLSHKHELPRSNTRPPASNILRVIRQVSPFIQSYEDSNQWHGFCSTCSLFQLKNTIDWFRLVAIEWHKLYKLNTYYKCTQYKKVFTFLLKCCIHYSEKAM